MFCCEAVSKIYETPRGAVQALSGVNLCCAEGTLSVIEGPSGCGKSSLLSILGGLDFDFEGRIQIDGRAPLVRDSKELDRYRRDEVGFVFQDFQLIQHLTVRQNVEVALALEGIDATRSRELAERALQNMDVLDLADRLPDELSGGQKQRVCLARATAKDPRIVLADEPTGSLDPVSASHVARVLRNLADGGCIVIVVTHNTDLFAPLADQVVSLQAGVVTQIVESEHREACASDVGSCDIRPDAAAISAEVPIGHGKLARLGFLIKSHLRIKARRNALVGAVLMLCVVGAGLIFSVAMGAGSFLGRLQTGLLVDYPLAADEDPSVTMAVVQAAQKAANQNTDSSVDLMLATVFDEVQSIPSSQDLLPLSQYVAARQDAIAALTYDVQFDYPLDMMFYTGSASGDYREISVDALLEDAGLNNLVDHGAVMAAASQFPAIDSIFKELIYNSKTSGSDDRGLYDVIKGRLPVAADEVVIVTNTYGQVSDYLLCLLGVVDAEELATGMIKKGSGSEGSYFTSLEEHSNDLYDALLDLELIMTLPCDYYQQSGGHWRKMSGEEATDTACASGIKLRVVGVVSPTSASELFYDPGAVAYTAGIYDLAHEHARESAVVKAQMNDQSTNVVTGRPFSTSHSRIEAYLRDGSLDWLSEDKREFVATLSNKRIDALTEWALEQYSSLDEALADASARSFIKERSYDAFVADIESIAPSSLDAAYQQALARLGFVSADAFESIKFYPKSFNDKDELVAMIEEWSELSGNPIVLTDSAASVMALLDREIKTVAIVLVVLCLIVCLVLGLVVFLSMRMAVIERMHEIGRLRALGASRMDIVRLFVGEALLLGAIGIAGGLLLDVLIAPQLNAALTSFTGVPNIVLFNGGVAACCTAVVLAIVAFSSWLPARKAAKVDPAKTLRAL